MSKILLTKSPRNPIFHLWITHSRRKWSCPDPANTCPMPPRELRIPTICRRRWSKNVRVISKGGRVRGADIRPGGTICGRGGCTISAIRRREGRSMWSWFARCIDAASVENLSARTHRTLPIRTRITHTKSWHWPYESWSRTTCRTATQAGIYGVTTACSCRFPRFKNGLSRRGKKIRTKVETREYFDWAFANFSGYIAVDELYDGPFCVLSVVDNREYKRLMYKVLDHAPTHGDIREFFRSLKDILKQRDLTLRGITTDGSPLYPEPIAEIFPGVRYLVIPHIYHDFCAPGPKASQAWAKSNMRWWPFQSVSAPGGSGREGRST